MGLGKTMNIKIGLCALSVCLALITPALGATYTAVCEDIAGVRVDDTGLGLELDKDQVRGATWTFRWSDANADVQMIMQNSRAAGGAQFTQQGIRLTDGNIITIVATLPKALWAYTLYMNGDNRLLATQHTTTASGERLSGKMMTGICRGA
jgi:hypothetical protein